jgi:hypothetical protein
VLAEEWGQGEIQIGEKTNGQAATDAALGSHLAGWAGTNDDHIVDFGGKGGDGVGGWVEVYLWAGG